LKIKLHLATSSIAKTKHGIKLQFKKEKSHVAEDDGVVVDGAEIHTEREREREREGKNKKMAQSVRWLEWVRLLVKKNE
jgi:hypothetical protein